MTTPQPLRKLLINLTLAIICLLPLIAQQMTTIAGQIIGKDGKPVEGAELKFERTDIKATYSIKTNREGKFNYATLPKGIYNITLTIKGEVVGRQEGIPTDPAKPIPFNVDLRNIQQAAQPVPDQAKGPTPEEIAAYEKAKAENDAQAAKNQQLNDVFNVAMQAAQAKNWNVAIENFIKAGEIDPTQHVVFAQLGEAYRERAVTQRGQAQFDDFERSAQAYSKAVALKADDASYHNNYALALGRTKKINEAQAEIAKAIQLDQPNAARYQRNLARMYFDTNQTEAAEAAFRRAIELDPNNPEAHYQLGLVLVGRATLSADGKMQAPPGTVEAFQKYLQLAPNGPEAEGAKAILETLGSTIQTTLKQDNKQKQKQK
jgi:Tfp pilus assembly protein PilF